ncbi:MAG: hypothetical protein C0504_10875 [Candidatus Solibacter sp.]|nr:hypothetical protein [Candidatus Solibacter sp.]
MLDKAGIAFLAVMAVAPVAAVGAEYRLLGALKGEVRNPAGTAQMGAVVSLYNRYERFIQKTLTDASGRFEFKSLAPDQYAVRVNLSTYIPANRTNIPVKAGMESYLSIELATIFSSIELVYTAPSAAASVMTDEWKWVLRSSGVTRPVLRALPGLDVHLPGAARSRNSNFELTRGLMRLSAGSEGAASALGPEPDLGTAFALATTVFGGNELRVLGNLGYASSLGTPVTAFRTSYSGASSPDLELTVRQVAMRHIAGQRLLGGYGGMGHSPLLRTMSAKVMDRQQITGEVTLEYGALLESVAFLDRMTIFSPFARLSTNLGVAGVFEMAYSTGAPPLDLLSPAASEGTLQSDMVGLAMFPRISLRGGHARVQRTESYEAGYRRLMGPWTLSAAAYHDRIRDAAFTVASPAGALSPMDLLPDIASNSSIFNLGNYQSDGVMSSVSRAFGDDWSAGIGFGWSGMLAPNAAEATGGDPAAMRSHFSVARRVWGSARLTGLFRKTGTRIAANYTWTPDGVVPSTHAWMTQRIGPQSGLNFQVRQPLPSSGFMPGRFEMTAEVRNLLAAGYMPIPARDGRTIYLVQFPRSLRGGFSFIF